MRTTKFQSVKLHNLFTEQKVVTMVQMKEILGTETDVTVFRKLKELDYYSSYSHHVR